MGRPGILLTEVGDGWEIRGVTQASPRTSIATHDPIAIAKQTLAFARQHSMDFKQVVIAVASDSVLFASVPAKDAVDIKNNQALRYALELVLPVDAECIVADSIRQNTQASTTDLPAVSMEIAYLKPIVDALEQAQCNVQFIVPASLLAFEQAIADRIVPAPSLSLWMLNPNIGPTQVEILELASDGSVRTWQLAGFDIETIQRHLLQLQSTSMKVFTVGNKNDLEKLGNIVHHESQSIEIDRDELIRKRAQSVLSGRKTPWIDLRRDSLATHDPWRRDRSSITRLAMATVLLLATLCGTLLWRAQIYRSMADRYEQKQHELFRSAFPAQRVPAAILGRLKSEHTKAKGIRKTDPKSTVPHSALESLRSVIESLSEDFPFQIEELRIENGRIAMEIELLSQQDAGKVAAALSKSGFNVEPPATTLVHGDHVLASFFAMESEAIR